MAYLDLLVHAIQPAAGQAWHGGPTPVGALRGVGAAEAWWRPAPRRKSIWMLTLHIAYWKYAIRRVLDGQSVDIDDRSEQMPLFVVGQL